MKNISCEKCLEDIIDKDDLVVINKGLFSIVPYHYKCYVEEMKSFYSSLLSKPINTRVSTIETIMLFCIMTIVRFFYSDSYLVIIFWILSILGIIIRLYSFFKYEK